MKRAVIRPVSFEEAPAIYRIVNDTTGMGQALLNHCEPDNPACQAAAAAVLALHKGNIAPESARQAFVAALIAAGIFVRGER